MSGAGLEIEIKLPVKNAAAMARRLRRLGARSLGRVHERNTLFDTPQNALGRSGRVLRVRAETKAERGRNGRAGARRAKGTLTFKSPVEGGRYKVRRETEVRVGSPERTEKILEGLGFRVWFRYEKFRTSYRFKGLRHLVADLDETPMGVYLELEGAPESIDRAAARLGYGPADYLRESYYELFERARKHGGFERGRMAFPSKP